MAEREELLRAVQGARTGPGLAAAVAALDAHDQARTAAIARSRETDMSATAVRATMTPVPLHEHHTAATDWLGDYEAPSDYRTAMIAEASRWYRSLPPELAGDPEEFYEQALGRAYTAASAYGDAALAARREFMTYLGYLTRQGASGLPQIQQTVDGNNQPAQTPLPPEPFDNFAPEQNELNAGVESPNRQSQISSDTAPGIQELERQDSGGSGFGSGPERPDEHSTAMDTSNSYAEVPLGPPGEIPTAPPGAAPSAPSAQNPAMGMENNDEGVQQRQGSIQVAAYTGPDHEGFRWHIGPDEDVDTFATPYHERCGSLHWPEEACHRGSEHTASVAVGYLMNAEDFTRRARFEAAGAAEGETVLRTGDLEKVAAHHNAIAAAFRAEARTEDEIAWLHGYLARVRPVLAKGGELFGGKQAEPFGKKKKKGKGKKKGQDGDGDGLEAQGSRLDFPDAPAGVAAEAMRKGAPFAGYADFEACVKANSDKRDPEAYCGKIKHQVEGASSLPQIQETVDSHDNPDPGGDQLNTAVMFPLIPAFGGGEDGQSKEAASRSMTPSNSALKMFGRMDAMEGKPPQHKDGYVFGLKGHGQYLRGHNETRAVIDATLGRDPVSRNMYAQQTGRPDLHKHYLGVYSDVKAQRDLDIASRVPAERAFSNEPGGYHASLRREADGKGSHLDPDCSCTHKPGHPCDESCPVHGTQKQGSRRTADFMTKPHESTDDGNPPFNSAQTSPQPWSSNQEGGDYQQGVRDGQEDASAGEHPTFADNSSVTSPYVKGYAVGYSGRPPDTGVQDVPRSMGGDSGQPMNAQQAQTAFQVSKASLQRTANDAAMADVMDTWQKCSACGRKEPSNQNSAQGIHCTGCGNTSSFEVGPGSKVRRGSLQRTAACIGCGHPSHLGEPCSSYGCTHQHYPGEMGGGPGSHAISIPRGMGYAGLPDDRFGLSQRPQDDYYGSGNQHDDSGYESDYGRYGPNGEDYDPGGRHAGSIRRRAHDFTESERENAAHSLGPDDKLPVNSKEDLKNAHIRAHQVKGIDEGTVDAYLDRLDKEYGYSGEHAHDKRAASRRPVSAAFLTRQAIRDPDFRKGYKFAARWQPGRRLVTQGSAAFEAGLYAAVSDRPAVQEYWMHAHQRLAQRHPVLGSRLEAHLSFSRHFAYSDARYRVPQGSCYLVPAIKRTAGTSVDLITDGPGTSPDPMGSTPLNGPGTPPPMGGGEDPARSGGTPPYQMGGSPPVAPDDVIGQPQEPPQESGPFTQTFSGRQPGNADLAPAAPNTAGGPGYTNEDAYQGDPQRYQQAMAFRRQVQASLAARRTAS